MGSRVKHTGVTNSSASVLASCSNCPTPRGRRPGSEQHGSMMGDFLSASKESHRMDTSLPLAAFAECVCGSHPCCLVGQYFREGSWARGPVCVRVFAHLRKQVDFPTSELPPSLRNASLHRRPEAPFPSVCGVKCCRRRGSHGLFFFLFFLLKFFHLSFSLDI